MGGNHISNTTISWKEYIHKYSLSFSCCYSSLRCATFISQNYFAIPLNSPFFFNTQVVKPLNLADTSAFYPRQIHTLKLNITPLRTQKFNMSSSTPMNNVHSAGSVAPDGTVRCYCGEQPRLLTSRTDRNPGRCVMKFGNLEQQLSNIYLVLQPVLLV